MIGLPDAGTVQKYALKSGNPRITAMPAESQTLMSTDVTQDDDGTTTVKWAKFLSEEGEPEIWLTGRIRSYTPLDQTMSQDIMRVGTPSLSILRV